MATNRADDDRDPPLGAEEAGAAEGEPGTLVPIDDDGDPESEDGWDAETTALLTRIFAEEAREHLEVISRAAMVLAGDEEGLAEILRRAHTLKGAASTVGFAAIGEAAHLLEERCVQLRGQPGPPGEEVVEWMIDAVDGLQRLVDQPEHSAELLEAYRRGLAEAPIAAGGGRRLTDRREVSVRLGAREDRRAEGDQREADRREGDRRRSERRADAAPSIRVDVDRVEVLMSAVGQLVVDRTSVERQVTRLRGLARDLGLSHQALRGAVVALGGAQGQPALERVSEVEVELADALAGLERTIDGLVEDSDRLGRTTRVLRDELTRVRMMPIGWVYARLQRTVRELSRAESKRVELHTGGESTEMDRSVVEKITDPLIHLVRNAIAHGIEPPVERRARGKPEVGRVGVSARHQGDMLFLEVEDDGAGIDPAPLREAGARLGLSPQELEQGALELIFTSGLSTRAAADGLAGRGVGLDVVRQNISSLSGEIRVSSRPGEGTRFSIRLPMTTAINQALLFKQGEHVYAVPVVYVVATHVPLASDLLSPAVGGGGWRVRLRGEELPLLLLDRILGGAPAVADVGSEPRLTAVIELAFGDVRFALGCTGKLVGPREIVLRRLGPLLGVVPLFAGATISGSGKVQLVLDTATLCEAARRSSGGAEGDEGWRLVAARTAPPRAGRVLVADDSPSVREAIALILRGAGFEVDLVVDGWDAWRELQEDPGRYDLLITDLEMPRIHGYDLIARCRGPRSALRELPILVLTSRTAPDNLERALAAGADRCIKKPVNRRAILDAVGGVLGAARS